MGNHNERTALHQAACNLTQGYPMMSWFPVVNSFYMSWCEIPVLRMMSWFQTLKFMCVTHSILSWFQSVNSMCYRLRYYSFIQWCVGSKQWTSGATQCVSSQLLDEELVPGCKLPMLPNMCLSQAVNFLFYPIMSRFQTVNFQCYTMSRMMCWFQSVNFQCYPMMSWLSVFNFLFYPMMSLF